MVAISLGEVLTIGAAVVGALGVSLQFGRFAGRLETRLDAMGVRQEKTETALRDLAEKHVDHMVALAMVETRLNGNHSLGDDAQ